MLIQNYSFRSILSVVQSLLRSYLQLQFLDLVKSTDEAVLEVFFNVGRNHLNVMVCVINLTVV